jgi:hypothetical protein
LTLVSLLPIVYAIESVYAQSTFSAGPIINDPKLNTELVFNGT